MLTILCVDSDPQRLKQISAGLASLTSTINILSVDTQKQALLLINQYAEQLAIVFISQKLSDGTSSNVFAEISNHCTQRILYCDSPSNQLLIDAINTKQIDYFLKLPVDAKQLINVAKTHVDIYQKMVISNKSRGKSNEPTYQDMFIDLSLYSDQELSALVINSLYKILEDSPHSGVKLNYSINHLLTREGERNKYLWFISKGRVQLQKRNAQGTEQNITVMEAGSIIGGMSFLTAANAFSSAVTLTETEVIKVDNKLFSKLMLSNTQLLAPFTNLLLRHFSKRLQDSISTELALQESLQSLDAAYLQLLESEKMAVLGQLITGVAHELNNPVSAILRGTQTLTEMMPALFANNADNPFNQLAYQTLRNALSINALSTAEVRKQTRKIQQIIPDKQLAKKVANMQLDESNIPIQAEQTLAASIETLYQYHQAGTVIRNSQSCAARISNLVQSLKHYAGQDQKEAVTVNIHEGIEETLIIFENRLKHFQIFKDYHSVPEIECHPIELEQVWTNIIANALDVMGSGGTLTISTQHITRNLANAIQVSFEDSGTGISNILKKKVFELNYTTKREGNFGLGIGLTISSQIIKRHHGHIHIEDGEQGGAKFIITLPVKKRTLSSSELLA